MTDHPYTDDDLLAEAAAQHAVLTDDPDFMGVGEGMQDSIVASTESNGGKTWGELLPYEADGGKAFNDAQRRIHDLIPGADVSEWAVSLGADGFQPDTEYAIDINADGRQFARVLFAFEHSVEGGRRCALVNGITRAVDGSEFGAEGGEPRDSDSDVFALIGEIAGRLREATDEGEYHAVGLIADLANGITTVADAREELAGITFRHV